MLLKQATDNSFIMEDVTMRENKSEEKDSIQRLQELAHEVKDDAEETDETFEGTSFSMIGVGRSKPENLVKALTEKS